MTDAAPSSPGGRVRMLVTGGQRLRGDCAVPGDKSVSHRAVMLGALAQGRSRVRGFLDGHDCLATVGVMRALGAGVERVSATELLIDGHGLDGLREPDAVLDCANSGTTMRLIAGLLAGRPFNSVLVGTAQLQHRPMRRIIEPLEAMGGRIVGRCGNRLAPLAIEGRALRGVRYALPVASAQVKSAVLLAGLSAQGAVEVVEPGPARDHTERMLRAMGAALEVDGACVRLEPLREPLRPLDLTVPGDASSAAFLLVAASIVPQSAMCLEGVGINPTRTGLLEALQRMGAAIEVRNVRDEGGEPVADLHVRHAPLEGIELGGEIIVRMIDEIPILAVAASQARGRTVVRDAGELRVKETDRIASTVSELRKLGADIEATDDGLVVNGPTPLRAAHVSSHGDHRLAMATAIAALAVDGRVCIDDAHVFEDSFPGFDTLLTRLGAQLHLEPLPDTP